jgi:hypothetical protein
LQLLQRADAKGISPLDLMLEVMHDLWQEGGQAGRFCLRGKDCALPARSYGAVEQKVEAQVRQTVINGEPMSAEEWMSKYGHKTDAFN